TFDLVRHAFNCTGTIVVSHVALRYCRSATSHPTQFLMCTIAATTTSHQAIIDWQLMKGSVNWSYCTLLICFIAWLFPNWLVKLYVSNQGSFSSSELLWCIFATGSVTFSSQC